MLRAIMDISARAVSLPVRPRPGRNRTAPIMAHDVERVLADIDADHGDSKIKLVWHGVLLVFGAPCQLPLLAGPEHGRTIPLTDIGHFEIPQRSTGGCDMVPSVA